MSDYNTKYADTVNPSLKLSVFGEIPLPQVKSLLSSFLEDYPEGRVRGRNSVIYGPVEGPYVAIYRTVGGSIVMRKCEDEDSSDQ